MLTKLKNFGRLIIPRRLFRFLQPYYHGLIALVGHWYFGRPSEKLIVIGVTGTAGKSTTINLLAQILNASGKKTGFITTANASDGKVITLNKGSLSMPEGFTINKQLQSMLNNGCSHAIIEATSEGLAQNRHLGIKFNGALLTSLAPAHLDAHGGFEQYKRAKQRLFKNLSRSEQSFIGVNLDVKDAEEFLKFPAQKKFGITLKKPSAKITTFQVNKIKTEPQISFELSGTSFVVNLFGEFNAYNTLMAVAAANVLGVNLEQCSSALKNFNSIPGRLQSISNHLGCLIFVDYAPEPLAMENSLRAINQLVHGKIIHIFGSTGGHRDLAKRFEFGKISAQLADTIIITNDDVYDSDAQQIAKNIEQGIDQAPNRRASQIMTVLDRRQAIATGLKLAEPKDIVVITGKGSEQFLVLPNNKRITWDEATVVQEELAKLYQP